MRTLKDGRLWTAMLSAICLSAVQAACAPPAGGVDGPGGQGEDAPLQEEQAEPIQQGESGDALEGDESPIEPEIDSDPLPCPPNGTALLLGFDHALTVNHQDVSINHFLHHGQMVLMVVDDAGTIESQGSPPLTYSMEGAMGAECTLTGQGTMLPSAHGSCENGVIRLFIDENWMALDGKMECVDSDGDVVVVPFDVPPIGLQQHTGPDGAGEIFYLVEGGQAYSSMRPFVEGEGYHTWTLSAEEVPLEPLVP